MAPETARSTILALVAVMTLFWMPGPAQGRDELDDRANRLNRLIKRGEEAGRRNADTICSGCGTRPVARFPAAKRR